MTKLEEQDISKKKNFIRINRQINSKSVRLISDDGEQVGIKSIDEALRLAEGAGLDLVEVAPNASPPVCKIMDFGKYKYELSKKEKSNKKKQVTVSVKEIRLRPKIEEHDYDFKMKHARKFLEMGNKVKATVLFRGRELAHKEFGRKVLDKLTEDLSDIAKVERSPLLEEKYGYVSCEKINTSETKMPKMKSSRAASKRFKLSATGKVKRSKAYKSHILTKKTTKRKRNLRQGTYVTAADEKRMLQLLA